MTPIEAVRQAIAEDHLAVNVYGTVEHRPNRGTFDVYAVQPTLLDAVNQYLASKNRPAIDEERLARLTVDAHDFNASHGRRNVRGRFRDAGERKDNEYWNFFDGPDLRQTMFLLHGPDGLRWIWDRDEKGGMVSFVRYTVPIREVVDEA